LWQQLPQKAGVKSIALDRFPEARADWKNIKARDEVAWIQEVVTALRTIRAELKLDPKKKVLAEFTTADAVVRNLIQANLGIIARFAALSELRIVPREQFDTKAGAVHSTALFDARIAHLDVVDTTAEQVRLKKDSEGLQKAIASKEKQLGNETFRSRAPGDIIKKLEMTLAEQRIELQKLQERLGQIA
jgi:valyl-tRNA synthetase